MKRFLWIVLFAPSLWFSESTAIQPVALDSAILRLVDGTPIICIEQVFSYAQNLIIILSGAKSLDIAQKLAGLYNFPLTCPLTETTSGPQRFGLLPYQGTYKTLKELIAIEKQTDKIDPELTNALDYLKICFEKLSIEYLEELQKNKSFMVPLIKNWGELRNRNNSLLLEWSNVSNNEKEALTQKITNLSISGSLIEDLLLFLSDLVQNCPKSHREYRENHKK